MKVASHVKQQRCSGFLRFHSQRADGLKQGHDDRPAPTRLLAFGVGDGAVGAATALNLRAISGTTAYNGTNGSVADYFQTADYPAAGAALRNLALGNRQGTLSVTKQIVPSNAPAGSIIGAVAAGSGWEFTGTSNTVGVTTPTAVETTTANGTGTVNYPLDFTGGVTTGSLTVAETQQAGFTLQPRSGQNAVCTNGAQPSNFSAELQITEQGRWRDQSGLGRGAQRIHAGRHGDDLRDRPAH